MSAITIGQYTVQPGQRKRWQIPVSRLPTDTWLSMPIEVVNGIKPGTGLWLCAAVHGDELNGVEVIRQVLSRIDPSRLAGHVIAVPILNVFGFINQSRYLPDRRDLNRSFPGSKRGSVAARLAYLFMTEVAARCKYGIDLHTGSLHRTNLPQIRANLNDDETRRCAQAFGAPVALHSQTREGSLREAAGKNNGHVLLYEAGEALRFDQDAISTGIQGVLNVMACLSMYEDPQNQQNGPTQLFYGSTWARARRGGIFRLNVELGNRVQTGSSLGSIADAFGENPVNITSPFGGVVIGHTKNPLVHQGQAIAHVARDSYSIMG